KKHRNYRLFFLGQTISLPGTWIQRFAQAWLVYSLTHHSALAVGVLAFAQFLPFTLFSLFAGVIVDRLDPRRTVIATQAVAMTLASVIAAITLAGLVQPWHVYVIAFLGGLVQVLDARGGIAYALHTREVLLILVLVLVVSTFCLNYIVLLPVVAKQTLHAGPRTFGALSAAFGAGALVGGLVAAAQGRARRSLMILGATGFGASELLLAPVGSIWLACALLFTAGVSFTTWSSNANSIVQLAAPDHLRGRVIGLYFFAFAGTGSVGGLMSGWLVHVGGTRLAFLVAGVAAIGGSAVVGRLLRTGLAPMRLEETAAEQLAA